MLPHVPAQAVLMIPPQPPAFCGVSRQRLHQPAGQTLLNKDSGLLQWVLGKLAELVGVDDVPVEDDSIGLDLTSEVQNHAKCQGVMEGDLQIVDDEPRFHACRWRGFPRTSQYQHSSSSKCKAHAYGRMKSWWHPRHS